MAITYGFFNSQDGDRRYTAADIGDYLQGIVSSGVYADSSSSLQVLASGGMNVEVQAGRALLHYKYLKNDGPHTLTLSAGGTMDRVDAIVARVDLSRRLCEIAVKEGTPAVSPVAPAMSRTDTKKEYMLASVYVKKLTMQITQENITDTRANTAVCGWVHGVIDQVDTTTLFLQYQAAYEERLRLCDEFLETLVNELNVQTYIQEYRNMVHLSEDTDTVAIGIDDYDPARDVLFVNYRGLLYMEEDYTVHGTGAGAYVVLTEARKAGDPIEFRVLKSAIGSAPASSTFAMADDDGTVLTDQGAAIILE